MNPARRPSLPAPLRWTPAGRAVVFFLSAMSIWCLLAEMYGMCGMRPFTIFVLLPATALLAGMALLDRARGDGRLWRGVVIGAAAGLAAAVAYDAFRLPFVFSKGWGLTGIVPPMPLFKVFPRFGAMILGEPLEQAHYSPAARLIGWAYHFSNGATFGVMYTAMLGEPARRAWWWGVVMAVAIEMCLLASPYGRFFGIAVTGLFIGVTLTAHVVFGAAMGAWTRWQAGRWPAIEMQSQ